MHYYNDFYDIVDLFDNFRFLDESSHIRLYHHKIKVLVIIYFVIILIFV